MEITKVSDQGNPLMKNPIKIMEIKLPPKGKAIGLAISRCEYNNLPYIPSHRHHPIIINQFQKIWDIMCGYKPSEIIIQ